MLPATIASIPKAFAEIKTWTIDTWEGDYRVVARRQTPYPAAVACR